LKIILAGYNVDSSVLDDLKASHPERQDVTPETLSASYARISRDPRPVDVLRAVARSEVEKARKSNRTIIFEMGHHSVAEHAVFNFDITGVSRLAVEEIEKFRLSSFTEKSQRYITLKGDYVLPDEIKKAGMSEIFKGMIDRQNALYHVLYERLRPYFFEQNKEMAADPKKHHILDGWAKEDARYVVSLATQGQLGMTINARGLEHLIRRFASKKLAELHEFNKKIYQLAISVAPSILLFTDANDFDALTYDDLKEETSVHLGDGSVQEMDFVRLVDWTPDADLKLISALLHTSSRSSYKACFERARKMSSEQKMVFMKKAFHRMEFYDSVLREFEYVDFCFDLVISASCFAQLKRHRMATMTAQSYDPRMGVTLPPSVVSIDAAEEFEDVIAETNDVYHTLFDKVGRAAEYILTNAHRKRVLLKVNARELYHIGRLRLDETAQWDIRMIASLMSEKAKKVMPFTCLMTGGKDAYPDIYRIIFGKDPKEFPPPF